MILKSTQAKANTSPATHQFVRGVGYIDHGAEPKIKSLTTSKPCKPGPKAQEESLHNLKSPGGNIVVMRWRKGLWWHPISILFGNRTAWSPEYFGATGWVYKSVVSPTTSNPTDKPPTSAKQPGGFGSAFHKQVK